CKQKLYLSAIFDLYDTCVITYKMSLFNNNQLAFDTFEEAIHKYPDAKPIFHSDRGFQYTSKIFKAKLDKQGMIQTMEIDSIINLQNNPSKIKKLDSYGISESSSICLIFLFLLLST
ncbi:MAG: DDE-type integrase/transposase/recombinase, partial [Bacilli bacterium]